MRPRNEDSVRICTPSLSGAGAHSRLATCPGRAGSASNGGGSGLPCRGVEEVLAGFRRAPPMESHSALLNRIVQSANARICETEALAGPAGSGMSSTVVVCALRFDRATIAHVGDSRCYLIRNQKARVITHDHTVANEQFRLGLLSKQEAKEVPTRHVLSRSLGSGLFVKVEIDEFQLLPDDVLLLCSDGLHGAVADEEIQATVLRNKDLEVTARELVNSANQQDGGDNVSIQLIRIRGVERMGMYRGRPYKLR